MKKVEINGDHELIRHGLGKVQECEILVSSPV